MKNNTLKQELLDTMDAYWRAANYLSVGQIYLCDNPLLKRPLTPADVNPGVARLRWISRKLPHEIVSSRCGVGRGGLAC